MREDIKDRSEHMRKIPEAAHRWMDTLIDANRLVYKRHGRYATCFCTKCGEVYEGCFRQQDTFEGQFEHVIPKPEHNERSKCDKCGAEGLYKAAGRYKGEVFTTDAVIGQKSGEDFVWRVFRVQLNIYGTDFNPIHLEKAAKIHTEYIRWWCTKGSKIQKDYLLYSWSLNRDEWYPHNIGGMNNIPFPWFAPIYKGTQKEIKQTPMYRYIPDPEKKYHPVNYYGAAARYYKDFEFITKNNLNAITNGLVYSTLGYRQKGKTPADRLGIYKERLAALIKTDSIDNIEIFKWEKTLKRHWTDEDIKIIRDIRQGYYWDDKFVKTLLKYSTPAKIGKYLAKFKDINKYRERGEYKDYIHMRQQAGYDLSNEIFLFPKDLRRRHTEMVYELEKEKIDKRKKEVLAKYKKIKSRYKKLSEKYSAAAGGYIIRPAKDAAEIVAEGRILHHCVGGDTYLKSHDSGKSFILFLRPVKEKDTPYITVEIRGNNIVQWYGAYDKKPNEKLIGRWLSTYVKELEKREKENCTGATRRRKTA